MTTEEEEEEEDEGREYCFTTDESIVELRRALYSEGRLGSDDKASSRISRRAPFNHNTDSVNGSGKSVVRTLFPARTSVRGARVGKVLITTESNPSPLVSSVRRSPPNVLKTEHEEVVGEHCLYAACSQDLFGSPVCTVPCSPPINVDSSLPGVGGALKMVESPTQLHLRTPQVGYPLVHSTPICLTEDHQSDDISQVHPTPSPALPSPHDSVGAHKMSTPSQVVDHLPVEFTARRHVSSEDGYDRSKGSHVGSIDTNVESEDGHDEVNRLVRKVGKDCAKTDDVLDVLFMSSSQLEAHFNLKQNGCTREALSILGKGDPVTMSVDETVWRLEETEAGRAEDGTCNRGGRVSGMDFVNGSVYKDDGDLDSVRDDAPNVASLPRKPRSIPFKYPKTRNLNVKKSRIRTREVAKSSPKTSVVVVADTASGLGVLAISMEEHMSVAHGCGQTEVQAGLASPPVKKRLSVMEEAGCSVHHGNEETEETKELMSPRCSRKLKLGNVELSETVTDSSETNGVVATEAMVAEGQSVVPCACPGYAEGEILDAVKMDIIDCGGNDSLERQGRVYDKCEELEEDMLVSANEGVEECLSECEKLKEEVPVSVDVGQSLVSLEECERLEGVSSVSVAVDSEEIKKVEEEVSQTDHGATSLSEAVSEAISDNINEGTVSSTPVTHSTGSSTESTSAHCDRANPDLPACTSKISNTVVQFEPTFSTAVNKSPCSLSRDDPGPAKRTPGNEALDRSDPVPVITKAIPTETCTFVGFKTASGSSITISAAALDKAKQLVSVELNDGVADCKLGSTSISKGVCSKRTDTVVGQSSGSSLGFVKPPTSSLKKGPIQRQKSRGFKLPRKASDVSESEERASVQRLLKGFGVAPSSSDKKFGSGKFSTRYKDSASCPRTYEGPRSSEVPNSIRGSCQNDRATVVGFQTAGGRGISVSSKSVQQAEELISKEWPDAGKRTAGRDISSGGLVPTGFSTAGGKGIGVSAMSLNRAQLREVEDANSLQDGKFLSERDNSTVPEDAEVASPCLPVVTTGFKTAGGKGISVSAMALDKVKEMVTDDLHEELPQDTLLLDHRRKASSGESIVTGFKTAGGRQLSVAADTMATVSSHIAEDSAWNVTCGHGEDMDASCVVGGGEDSNRHGHVEFVITDTKCQIDILSLDSTRSAGCEIQSGGLASTTRIQLSPSSHTTRKTDKTLRAGITKGAETVKTSSERVVPNETSENAAGCSKEEEEGVISQQGKRPVDGAFGMESMDDFDASQAYLNTQVVKQFMNLSNEDENIGGCLASPGHTQCRQSGDDANILDTQHDEGKVQGAESFQLVLPERPDAPGSEKLSESAIVSCMNLSSINGLFEDSCSFTNPSSQLTHGGGKPELGGGAATPTAAGSLEDCKILSLVEDPTCGDSADSEQVGGARTGAQGIESQLPADEEDSLPTRQDLLLKTPNDGKVSKSLDLVQEGSNEAGVVTLSSLDSVSEDNEEVHTAGSTQEKDSSATSPSVSEEAEVANKDTANDVVFNRSDVRVMELMEDIQLADVEMSEDAGRDCGTGVVPGGDCGTGVVPGGDCGTGVVPGGDCGTGVVPGGDCGTGVVPGGVCRPVRAVTSFQGFHTANGKDVEISAECQEAAKARLDNIPGGQERDESADYPLKVSTTLIEESEHNYKKGSDLRGFHTASGKRVAVSEESIAAARHVLDGVNSSDQSNDSCNPKTSGKQEFAESLISIKTPRNGLQTASGRSVEISHESLEAARAVLAGGGSSRTTDQSEAASSGRPTSEGRGFPGLGTASGKKVKVKKQSLLAVKSLWGETPSRATVEGDSSVNMDDKVMQLSDNASNCSKIGGILKSPGFQRHSRPHTAAGSHIEITPQSLQAARLALGVSWNSPNEWGLPRIQGSVTMKGSRQMSSVNEQCGKQSASPSVGVPEHSGRPAAIPEFKRGQSSGASRKSNSSRLREMQAKVQKAKASLTSVPEGEAIQLTHVCMHGHEEV